MTSTVASTSGTSATNGHSKNAALNERIPEKEEAESDTTARTTTDRTFVVPWVLFFFALYAFCLPWMHFAILHRYFLSHDNWNSVLPGLGTTLARRITMGGHMACGAI
jgi:hypothetical protein